MKNEICVSAEALALDAEGGGAVAPGVGDEVDFSGRGRVSRVEGGTAYIEATEINGQPTMGGEGDNPMDDAGLDGDVLAMQGGGGGGGGAAMGGLLLAFFCAIWLGAGAITATAKDVEWARARSVSGGAVSNAVLVARETQVFSVEINNFSGSTLYLLVFDSATNQLAGALPHYTAVPIPTGSAGGKAFGSPGAPFDRGVNVCLSTTPFSLTNATSGGTATVIHSGGAR